jgi:DNA-binding IclR family transcriptional regulator
MENISSTVNKAIDILEVFLQKDGEFSLAELADLSGFNKATAYRLVSTLVKRGFINQEQKKREILPGSENSGLHLCHPQEYQIYRAGLPLPEQTQPGIQRFGLYLSPGCRQLAGGGRSGGCGADAH